MGTPVQIHEGRNAGTLTTNSKTLIQVHQGLITNMKTFHRVPDYKIY